MENIINKLREYRLGPFAMPDLVGTLIFFYLISRYTNTNPILMISGGLALGVVVHKIVGQSTPLNDIIEELLINYQNL